MELKNDLSKIYIKNQSFIHRKILEEALLVPLHNRAEDVNSIYAMNEVAAFIWERLEPENPLWRIRDDILEEFEVERDEARDDLLDFIRQMELIGAVNCESHELS